MNKKTFLGIFLLIIVALSGCSLFTSNSAPEPITTPEIEMIDYSKPPDQISTPTDAKIPVDFHLPVKLDKDEILKPYLQDMLAVQNSYLKSIDQPEITLEEFKPFTDGYVFYDSGTIKEEPYKNWKLIVLTGLCDGMCLSSGPNFRFAWNPENNTLVLLSKYSDQEFAPSHAVNALLVQKDETFTIEKLSPPKTILMPDKKHNLELESENSSFLLSYDGTTQHFINDDNVVFTDPTWGKIYTGDATGCLYLVSPDGAIHQYAFDPKFYGKDANVNINWDDKSPDTSLTEDYSFVAGGCGVWGRCYSIDKTPEEELKKVGTTSNGFELFELIAPKETVDGKTETNGAQIRISSGYLSYKSLQKYYGEQYHTVQDFQSFINLKPLLYWKDPLGRFSPIMREDMKPPVECGKPVIYLYPESPTDVSVQVGIDEFTKTDPDYGINGWHVKAFPDGKIFNYADGASYPYLFWEGKSKKYVSTDKGFVIAKEEASDFLNTNLKKLGLNDQETSDFLEFWLPRIERNTEPFVFISFIGTNDFNKIAPLIIEPKPQTLIRVFMYYEPLMTKTEVIPQELKSIPRNGFTVIEWGGTSSAFWQWE